MPICENAIGHLKTFFYFFYFSEYGSAISDMIPPSNVVVEKIRTKTNNENKYSPASSTLLSQNLR